MTFPVLLLTLLSATILVGAVRRRSRRIEYLHSSTLNQQPNHWDRYRRISTSDRELESAKSELRAKLNHSSIDHIAQKLATGPNFHVQVLALTEIGTQEAAIVLERQLKRQLSNDPVEQSAYWTDIAHGLRELNRLESLPTLLRCAERVIHLPLGHLFAAEIVRFPNFAGFLDVPLAVNGQSSLFVFYHVLRSIRQGLLPVDLFADGQLGEVLNRLIKSCPGSADALVSLVFLEVLRTRSQSLKLACELQEDSSRRQMIAWQLECFTDAEPIVREYLHDIGEDLGKTIPYASTRERSFILEAIYQLRTDVTFFLFPLLDEPNLTQKVLATLCLSWSKSPHAFVYLLEKCRKQEEPKTQGWWVLRKPSKSLNSQIEETRALLTAIRHHPCRESEEVLIQYARSEWNELRIVALSNLGWWEPIQRSEVLNCLHMAKQDSNSNIRFAGILALCRLGEINALEQIRNSLKGQNAQRVHEAIDLIAQEGLTWLWPDLDELSDSNDSSVAIHAWEAIERLREQVFGPLG
jgi:hypothetical protein